MKTKILTRLFLLAFASLSLYSCTADTLDEAEQKNNVLPKVTSTVAEEGDNPIVEPNIIKTR